MTHAPAEMHSPPTRRNRQGGSILLEALIAILIFSMGILALVGLQAAAISNVTEAKYRSDAAFLANQLSTTIWVDKANIASYAYSGSGSVPPATQNWVTQVNGTLPGTVTYPPIVTVGSGNLVTITVRWKMPKASSPHQHVVVAQIN